MAPACCWRAPSPLFAQTPARDGRLIVTVVDQTRAVIPGRDRHGQRPRRGDQGRDAVEPVKTDRPGHRDDRGLRARALSGHRRSFPASSRGVLKDVRIRSAGDNKHVVVLAIQGLQDSVTVGRDAQEAAADRSNGSFGTALTREQIDALSDDPTEMAQQLQDMAGGNAVIRVDSFEGGQLPPKAMIKAIHITRDAFAAENHTPAACSSTSSRSPASGRCAATCSYSLRDGVAERRAARSPQVKGPGAQQQNYGTQLRRHADQGTRRRSRSS